MSRSASATLLKSESVRAWSKVRRYDNLFWLALDYLTGAAVIAGAVWFNLSYKDWGLNWLWHIPVWGAAIILMGAVQHRIALMGHESSHHLLFPNRKWNDILAEIFCFYPLFGSMTTYRAKHLPHHLYPNDPERDPNLGNGKWERLYAKFPMPKISFIYQYYLKFFWPPFILANLLDLLDVLAIGSGMSPIPVDEKPNAKGRSKFLRVKATVLGVAYLVVLVAAIQLTKNFGWQFWATVGGLYLVAVIVWYRLPASAFYSGARLSFPHKSAGLLRLSFYTLLFTGFELLRRRTGLDATWPYTILWIFPLIYVFPYLMLLREVGQHANAGTGQLDNSRITHIDPFSRWAVFGYGNDFHLVHHIYPNVPHYHLRGTHDQLSRESDDYREGVEVTYGTLTATKSDGEERVSLLDSLASDAPMPHNHQPEETREN